MPAGPVIANNTPLAALWAIRRLDLLESLFGDGRRFARRLGFPVIGTLGVLLLAKENDLLGRVGPVIEDLRGAGLYLAPSLITKVLHLANEA